MLAPVCSSSNAEDGYYGGWREGMGEGLDHGQARLPRDTRHAAGTPATPASCLQHLTAMELWSVTTTHISLKHLHFAAVLAKQLGLCLEVFTSVRNQNLIKMQFVS